MDFVNKTINIDSRKGLKLLPDESIDCCVTSPPYYRLRDYNVDSQIGLEETPESYIEQLAEVFTEVFRALKPTGTLWLNIGDSYAGSNRGWGDNKKKSGKKSLASYANIPNAYKGGDCKPKDLIGIPWMLAFALRKMGWYWRDTIIWGKPNPMPESVEDRCTKSHEYILMFSKSKQYYYDYESIMEEAAYDGRKDTRMNGSHKYSQGVTGINPQSFAARGHERWKMRDGKYLKNKRSVWAVPIKPFKEAHFATYPPELIVDCIKAGCPENGIVLDPFGGSGTTGVVAKKLNRRYVMFELNPEYIMISNNRFDQEFGFFNQI